MLNDLKPLVVILALALAGFALVRPLCTQFMPLETFNRRRNVWLFLTVVAFLSPSFGIYIVITTVVLIREVSRERNLVALFLWMLFVVPNARFFIPTVLINNLFDLSQIRLLTFILLLPFIVRSVQGRRPGDPGALTLLDGFVLGFLALQVGLSFPQQSATVTMRQSFLTIVDVFVLYYALSRLKSIPELHDVLASFFVAAFIMGLVGCMEWLRSWLLYDGLTIKWGDPTPFSYLLRGDRLRAQAATGHSLGLGSQLAAAFGVYLFLRNQLKNRVLDKVILALLSFGLFATGSRGPWLTAVLTVLTYLVLRPGAARKIPGAVLGSVVIIGIMYLTPLRESILDRLPFIGTSEQETVEYRQRLAEVSWRVIGLHPFFGDPMATEQMEDLRQGQGIIDIVNGYIYVLLFTGWVGMSLFGGFLVGALFKGVRAYSIARSASELQAMGSALIGCFAGCLLFIAVAGRGPLTYIMAGMLVSYATVVRFEAVRSKPGFGLVARGGRQLA